MITSSLEEYLRTIYVLKNTKGQVRVTDISKKLNCSKPSVNRALNCLKEEGLITYETYGEIDITKTGEKIAKSTIKRWIKSLITTFYHLKKVLYPHFFHNLWIFIIKNK